MKPHEICEMAIKGGNFRPIADKYASEYSKFLMNIQICLNILVTLKCLE